MDGFAFRKGQHYGTILVDLDTHCPIALLPDRESETLAQWLKQHPGVQVLSRDRSKVYKRGMSQEAPDAVQVADRFHLLDNLAEVLQQTLKSEAEAIKAAERVHYFFIGNETDSTQILPAFQPKLSSKEQQYSQRYQTQRQALYQTIHTLYQQGKASAEIAA